MKLKRNQSIIAVLAAMMLAFGITDFNFSTPSFDGNEKAYILIIFGLFIGLMAFWSKLKN